MLRENARIGMEVRSNANPIYRGTYKIIKMFKNVCWVELNEDFALSPKGQVYKNIPYSLISPIMTPEKVAEYADKDSMALKDVKLEDMLEEIYIRGGESNTLTRLEVIRKTRELVDNMQTHFNNSI